MSSLRAQVFIWSGTADWSSSANWSPTGIPGVGNTAQIATGTVTVSDTRSVSVLTLTGGTITGGGALTIVSINSTWSGGTLSGTGQLNINSGANLTVSGAAAKTLDARTLNNSGTVSWTAGTINSGNGAIISNASGATLTTNFDGTLANSLTGTRVALNNAGTFTKSAGTGTTDIQANVTNTGTINANSGLLQLSGGGTSSSTMNIAAFATLRLATNPFSFTNGAQINGSGTLDINSGTTTTFTGSTSGNADVGISAATATFNGSHVATGNLTLATGGIINGTGALAINSGFTWAAGAVNGNVTVNGSTTISGAAGKTMNGGQLTLAGNTSWSAGSISASGTASIVNNALQVFNTTFDGSILSPSGTPVFTNAGIFTKSGGTGITDIQPAFNNTGTVNVNTGTLRLSGGGSSSSTFNVNGATLRTASNYVFNTGTRLDGTGTVDLTSTTAFNGSTSGTAGLTISAGTTSFNGAHIASGNLTLSGGTLQSTGSGNVTVTGSLFWTGGTLNGTVNANGAASLSGLAKTFNTGGLLTLAGATSWTAGNINGGGGASLVNGANGTFTTNFDGTFAYNQGGARPVFTNSGTFTKTAGTGTTDIQATFNSTGIVNANSGTLQLSGGGSVNGSVNIGPSGSLVLTNGLFLWNAPVSGTGSFAINSGTVAFGLPGPTYANLSLNGGTATAGGPVSIGVLTSAGGTLDIPSLMLTGASSWTAGAWSTTGASTVIVSSTGSLALSSGDHHFDSRNITNNGSVTWSGGWLRSGHGASVTNNLAWNDTNPSSVSADAPFSGTWSFTNAATGNYTKSGAGTTTFNVPFNNAGTVTVNGGLLSLNAGNDTVATGTFTVGASGSLRFGGGTYTLANGSSLIGPGTFSVTSGTLAVNTGSVSLSNLGVSGGTLDGAGTATIAALAQTGGVIALSSLTLSGNSSWTGGTWSSSAASTATINSGVALALNTADHHFDNRSITNNGTVTWSGGWLRSGHGASLINNQNWNDTNSGNVNADAPFGGTWSFMNAASGFYTKSGTGITTFGVPFNNSGAVDVNGGTLSLNGGGDTTAGGEFNVGPDGNFRVTGGTYNLANGSSLSGTGTFGVTGGTLNVNAGIINLPNFSVSGGTLTGAASATLAGLNQTGGVIALNSLTLSGNSSWTGGTWTSVGPSLATIDAGVTLALNTGDHQFDNRSITNNGIVNWSGGWLRSGHGATLLNNLTWNDTNPGNVNADSPFGGVWSFTNAAGATYAKSGAGTTTFDVAFNNSGTVNVTGGTLSLSNGNDSVATGSFTVDAGAGLRFSGGTYNLANGSLLSGAGTFSVTGGTLAVNTGTANLSNLTVNGGTLAGAGTATVGALTETGGIIAISALTLTGASTWSGGTWTSPTASVATINANASLALSSGDHHFDNRSITNNGTMTWSGGWLRSGHGASLINNNAWLDTNPGNVNADAPFGGTWTFINAPGGTYTKSGGGTTTFNVAFNNNAAVNVTGGTLTLAGGGATSSGGTFNAASGTTVNFSGGASTIASGASLGGLGTYQLTGGTLDVTGNITVSTFNQTGGTLGGTHEFLGGTINWSGGNWNAGATGFSTTIRSGVALNLIANNAHDFDYRAIVNQGTINWAGNYIRSGHGGSLTNEAGASFYDQATTGTNYIYPAFSGGSTFTNNGTYSKTGASTTEIQSVFNNNALVSVQAGTLRLNGGGTNSSTGSFQTASGAFTEFNGDYTVTNGSSLTGPGTYLLTGGTLTVNGGITVSTFNQTNGTLGGTNTLLGGTFNWSSGNWNTAALGPTTTIGSGATLNLLANNVHDFDFRAITNQGTVNWAGNHLRSGDGGSFTNDLHATFNDQSNGTGTNVMTPAYGGVFTFTNNGTYSKTGTSNTDIAAVFNNNATVSVQAGRLRISGNGGSNSSTGSFNTAAGAVTEFASNFSIASGTALTGPGTYELTGGTLTVTGDITVSTFNQTNGTFAGTQNLLAGTFNWSGGNWNASGLGPTTTIGSNVTLNLLSNNVHDFDFRGITNQGTVNWQGNYLRSGDGGSFTNAAGAHFNDQNATGTNYIFSAYGGTFTFSNNGFYTKTGAGTSEIQTPFNNSAAVSVQAGTLRLTGGGTNSGSGSFNTGSGATLQFGGGNYVIPNGTALTGPGLYLLSAGTLTVDGDVSLNAFTQTGGVLAGSQQLLSGTFTWSSGNWNTGALGPTTTIGPAATLELSDTNTHDFDYRAVTNQGTVNWVGNYIRSGHGGSFTNAAGAMFNDLSNAETNFLYPAYGGAFTFTNNGTYRKTGSGETQIQSTFTNNGSLRVEAGTMRFTSTFAQSGGTIAVLNYSTLRFDQNLNLAAGNLIGAGTVQGDITSSGLISPGSNSRDRLNITGSLTLLAASSLLFEIGGTEDADYLNVTGAVTLNGTLQLAVVNGFTPTSGQVFNVANAASITGAFTNVPMTGLRLNTIDNLGSFQVNFGAGSAYGANSLTLSNFAAVPEPGTWALLALGGLTLALTTWRQRRR